MNSNVICYSFNNFNQMKVFAYFNSTEFCSALQTGSGKTHTMLGEIDDLEVRPSPHRGMTPRIFEFLFARIQAVILLFYA